MVNFNKRLNFQVSMLSIGIALATPAFAADTVEQSAVKDDIIVTARRSSEKLQEVPLSITAQTAEDLAVRGVSDLEGVARFTPSLQFKDFVTTFHGNAVLRGLSQINTSNPVGNVGVFIDGIYLQRGYMVDTSLGDFARVEVVKGPQSALYGQNTFAGAVNYVTNTPGDELAVNASGTFGTYGRKELQVGVGGPIIDGVLGARLYVGKSMYGGSWRNNLPTGAGDLSRFGGYDREAFSGKLVFTPLDGLKITASYQQTSRKEELRPYYTLDGTFVEDKLNCGPVNVATGRPSLFCGQFPTDPAAFRSGTGNRPAGLFSVEQPATITKTEVASVALGYELSDAIQFNYLFGWAKGQAQEDIGAFSNTYNPTGRATLNYQHEGGALSYKSHEARLSWDTGAGVQLEGGYFHSNARDQFLFGFNTQDSGRAAIRVSSDPLYVPPSKFIMSQNFDVKYKIDSVFGRATVKLFDERLTLGAEGRYSWTDISFLDLQKAALGALEASYGTFSPRFTVDYRLTSDNMLYASAAKGIKNGGFNGRQTGGITLTTAEQTYGEEMNWTYEVGAKNSFMNGALIANVALFYVDWSKKQNAVPPSAYVPPAVPVAGAVPPNIYQTSGSATSYGVELDGRWKATDNLTFNYSATWMKPTYDDGTIAAQWLGLCNGVNCPTNAAVGGNQIERTSQFSGALGAEYTRALTGDWDWFIGGDVTYQSKQYGDAVNASYIGSYALGNARLGVSNDTWKAWLWVNNVADKKYVQSVFVIQNLRANQVALGERRTAGISIAANF